MMEREGCFMPIIIPNGVHAYTRSDYIHCACVLCLYDAFLPLPNKLKTRRQRSRIGLSQRIWNQVNMPQRGGNCNVKGVCLQGRRKRTWTNLFLWLNAGCWSALFSLFTCKQLIRILRSANVWFGLETCSVFKCANWQLIQTGPLEQHMS